jgi:hypothetical protein
MSGGFRVSDSTIETAAKAFWVGWDLDEEAPEDRQQCLDDMRRTLAAVLPSLVAEIREQIASEIEAVPLQRRPRTPGSMLTSTDLTARQMRDAAARVARGDAG